MNLVITRRCLVQDGKEMHYFNTHAEPLVILPSPSCLRKVAKREFKQLLRRHNENVTKQYDLENKGLHVCSKVW